MLWAASVERGEFSRGGVGARRRGRRLVEGLRFEAQGIGSKKNSGLGFRV